MKRWMIRILLCLILGAITTVAVAWGCALWSSEPTRSDQSNLPWSAEWPVMPPAGWPSKEVGTFTYHSFGITEFHAMHVSNTDAVTYNQWSMCFGLPCRALFYERHRVEYWAGFYGPLDFAPPRHWREGLTLPFRDETSPLSWGRWLPTQPLCSGFVIDTLFYAAIWGGVWFGFVGGKRFIRTKRGRCPRCGYDLRGQRSEVKDQRSAVSIAGCPECGWGRG